MRWIIIAVLCCLFCFFFRSLSVSCVFCAPLDWYISHHIGRHSTECIGRHIGRVSTDMSADISVECRSICRLRCVGRHINWHIGWASVDMSTKPWPICWLICRPRVVGRLSSDMSIDRLLTFHRYFTATCKFVTVPWVVDLISPVVTFRAGSHPLWS